MLNNEINIEYRGKHVFDLAMKLAFTSEYIRDKPQTVCGYRIFNNSIFLHGYISDSDKNEGYVPFPYEMGLDECISFVWGWLQKTKPTYNEPDTDGSVDQGFKITTDGTHWRGGDCFHGTFIAITPIWIVYGK